MSGFYNAGAAPSRTSDCMWKTLTTLNWRAVVGATLVYFVLGGLWYSPMVFGPVWREVTGPSPLHEQPSVWMFVVPLAGSFAGATATALLVRLTGVATLRAGAQLGTLVACAFVVPAVATDAAAPNHPQPLVYGALVGAYHLVGLVLVSLVVTRFRGARGASA